MSHGWSLNNSLSVNSEVDPIFANNWFADLVWLNTDENLVLISGRDVRAVAACIVGVLGGGEQRVSNNSVAYKKNNHDNSQTMQCT